MDKLQKEIKELKGKGSDEKKLKDQLESTQQEHKLMKNQMQEILQDKISFKLRLEEQKEKLDMIGQENSILKERLHDME